MARYYDIAATVKALAPVLKRGGFRQKTHKPRLFGKPEYKSLGDVVVFEKGQKAIHICVDRGEVYLVLIDAGSEPVRPDLDCPRDMTDIGGVPSLP
ncbi:hypothetical protein [Hyphobacterium sp.]|uniref:hypothetical protein n=1 Tax=Hyphobacterium sp. TaxID=2004662 RepID=UPI003BACF471